MFTLLSLYLLLIKCSISANIEEDFFFDDFGAWILCRKIVEGVNGNFGVGYDFTVKYELTNIGTQTAHNIKIEDTWNWEYVKRFGKQIDSENIIFEAKQLKPKGTATFSYKLRPLSIGIIAPNRANISYYVGDDEDDYTLINGQSSNWISNNDEMLMVKNKMNNNKYKYKYNKNINNNQLVILSSLMYSRSISYTFFYWILFVVFCVISIAYPLCEYESSKGDFSFMPFGIGYYAKAFTRYANMFIVSKIKQQIANFNKTNKGKIPKKKDN